MAPTRELRAVVPGVARSYLREGLRYDLAQEGTTARSCVRPRAATYDRAESGDGEHGFSRETSRCTAHVSPGRISGLGEPACLRDPAECRVGAPLVAAGREAAVVG